MYMPVNHGTVHNIPYYRVVDSQALTICSRNNKEWQSVYDGNSAAVRHQTVCSKSNKECPPMHASTC